MSASANVSLFQKLFSLLSVVRGYNILVLIMAQYLAAIFIFSPEKDLRSVIFDIHLFYIVIATICVVAGGYIINNFYDAKADKINRPHKAVLDSLVSQRTKLSLYFTLNFLGVLIAYFVSWRASLFFAVYIFGIWFYSHKLKKYPLTGLLSATMLTILPFFAVFVYFKNFSKVIFVHATFLFLVIMVRELVKDLENLKGAVVSNYLTFPVAYGEKITKLFALFLLFLTLVPIVFLFNYPHIFFMRYYFYFALVSLIIVGVILSISDKKSHYTIIHTALKLLLLLGVFCLVFIEPDLLIKKVMNKLD